jgi:hypothetical protein
VKKLDYLYRAFTTQKVARLMITTRLSSYCDEFGSATDPNKKYLGIVGLLGSDDHWKTFDSGWRSVCEEEKVPWPFHTADFVHAKEDFKSARWTDRRERMRVITLLLNVIDNAGVFPVAAAVVLRDFNDLSKDQKQRLNGPYFAAFQEVTYNLAFGAALIDYRSALAMCYAKLKKFTGPAEAWWHGIKEINPVVGRVMGSYARAEPRDESALQAADIFAYSIGRTAESDPRKSAEATLTMRLFDHLIWHKSPGNKCFVVLNRKELLDRLGESDEQSENSQMIQESHNQFWGRQLAE